MNISTRIANITGGGSDGWDVFYRARAMIAAGIRVTDLTIGEHDVRTHPAILDAMQRSAAAGHTGYAMVPGTLALRQAVAARVEARTGVATSFENVIITPGGQSALFAAHLATCNPGERALFLDPYYATYPGTIRSAGAVPVPVPTDPADAFQPRADRIAPFAKNASSLLINSPNNPTGAVYTRATLDGIAQTCRDNDLWLISDEVYDTQIWEGAHVSPRALPGMAQRTLVIGSMSKSHAMTGSRIGWIVAPTEVIRALSTLATHTTYGVPGYIQDAALFALNEGAWLEDTVARPFRRRRNLALDILAGQNLVQAVPCQGAMYLMLDIRNTGLTGDTFANALLDGAQIAVMPGESFGRSAAGHIRVALTLPDAECASALEHLVAFAKELGK